MIEVGKCLIKNRLRIVKLTQQDLADRLGMSKTQVSDYANGHKKMSLKTAKKVAIVLDCNIDDLYEWVPEDSNR